MSYSLELCKYKEDSTTDFQLTQYFDENYFTKIVFDIRKKISDFRKTHAFDYFLKKIRKNSRKNSGQTSKEKVVSTDRCSSIRSVDSVAAQPSMIFFLLHYFF